MEKVRDVLVSCFLTTPLTPCPSPSPPHRSRRHQTERDAILLTFRLLYLFVKRSWTSRGGGCSPRGSYATRRGPPVGFMEEQLDDHIMGVVMAEHFSLKKGIRLFEDKLKMLQLRNSKLFTTWVHMNPSMHPNLQEKRSVTPSNPYYSLQKKGMGKLKAENALWVANNVRTTDMTNPPPVLLL